MKYTILNTYIFQEQPEKSKDLDDDEDSKNPAYVPRKGMFYEHDFRSDDTPENEKEELPEQKLDIILSTNRNLLTELLTCLEFQYKCYKSTVQVTIFTFCVSFLKSIPELLNQPNRYFKCNFVTSLQPFGLALI